MEETFKQERSVGHHPIPLLSQLGPVHFINLDAFILQPSTRVGPGCVRHLIRATLVNHGYIWQHWGPHRRQNGEQGRLGNNGEEGDANDRVFRPSVLPNATVEHTQREDRGTVHDG